MSSYENAGNETRSEKDSGCEASESVRKAFAALPLDQKLATLVRVELDMLGEAVNTVVAAASRVADEIADVFTEPRSAASEGPSANSSAKF